MARILIVEDEPTLQVALTDLLIEEGHKTLVAVDGGQALETAFNEKPDLVLLDVMLPILDGYEVCKELRKRGFNQPILMLTAKDRIDDRVRGLDVGSDDYLVKPFSTRELLARVRALLRRATETNQKLLSDLKLEDIMIDFARNQCRRGASVIHLTAREFAMLRLLVEKDGETVSREEFLDRVWDYHSFPTTRTVDNHIASLRSKLEATPSQPRWIKTVHRIGYRLEI